MVLGGDPRGYMAVLYALALLIGSASAWPRALRMDCSQPEACMLPSDLLQWSRAPGFNSSLTRFWDRTALDAGISGNYSNRAHPALVRSFFGKLTSGKGIVAVALGSSLVHDFAGCFHSSEAKLWSLGMIPNPTVYPNQGLEAQSSLRQHEAVVKRCGGGGGFMEGVMYTINATYPNADHIFLNNGKGGASLTSMVSHACFSDNIPKHVDLVLMDTIGNGGTPEAVERLLRFFLRKQPDDPPLVVLFSTSMNCQGHHQKKFQHYHCEQCTWGNQPSVNCTLFDNGAAYDMANYLENDEGVRQFQPVAQQYSVAHINFNRVMGRLHHEERVYERMGITPLQLLRLTHVDTLHLRKQLLGPSLVSDTIINWLAREQEDLNKLSAEERSKLVYTSPKKALHEAARKVTHSRCYGFNVAAILKSLRNTSSDHEKQALDWFTNILPGDEFAFAENQGKFHALPDLRVTNNAGWTFKPFYAGKDGSVKYKPGYVTDQVDATLDLEVDSKFATLPLEHNVNVSITYTVSYASWGRAEVSCIANCRCKPAVLDATHQERTSLLAISKVPVSQHAECQLRVRVLPETSSEGHQFKVSSIAVVYDEEEVVEVTDGTQAGVQL